MAAAPKTAPVLSSHGSDDGGVSAGVSFVRGSGEGRYVFEVQSGLSMASAIDVGPIDVKAYDYMRSLLIYVQATGGGGTTTSVLNADAPLNAISYLRVKQPNGQTMYSVSSGFHAGMIQKYGLARGYAVSDPKLDAATYSIGAGTTGNFSFCIRIPFELDLRDALGALPNKDAAAPFTLELGLNASSSVYQTAPTTLPTLKITPVLEAYDQPPETLDGLPVETTPPNMNTLQRWTEQNYTVQSGAFDARVRKLGNYVRELIFITKNSSSVRQTAANGWSDPQQIVLDEDVKDNIPLWLWEKDLYETWGINTFDSDASAQSAAGGYVVAQYQGVWPYQYAVNRRMPDIEDVAKYLPTIESEDYILRGQNWGTNASKLVTLVCEVLPRGDIFGDA